MSFSERMEGRGGTRVASGGCIIILSATTEFKRGCLLYLLDTTACVASKLCNFVSTIIGMCMHSASYMC